MRSKERTNFLGNILVTAVEGGINYWAETRNFKFREDVNRNITHTQVDVREVDDGGSYGEWQTITLTDISHGLRKIERGEVHINRALLGDIVCSNINNDASEIDSVAADCIVQAAMFGVLVYG